MEEDSGVKAPVTRLRRRLSVEQSEESKSPAPNTPTKTRRGRRKPELELIEENSTTKTTPLKTVAKDLVEEEKPVTPSRRSARIRSNTSIVSETAAVVDSPRAKRAARRLSQVGSDTESTTPARQTRRTRKDSTSSLDKAETQVAVKQNTIPESITEENETINQQPVLPSKDETNESSQPVRKSPRLQEKKGRKSKSSESPEKTNEDLNKSTNNSDLETKESESPELSVQVSKTNDITVQSPVKKSERLSMGSAKLLENINDKPCPKITNLNKSTTALKNLVTESKRSRTKSCTVSTLSATTNDNVFFSDNESTNERRKSKNRTPLKQLNISGSNKSLNKSINKEKSLVESPKNESTQKEKSDNDKDNSNNIPNIFKQNPTSDMKVTITFEDSDSNPERLNKADDDQCVPEVDHINKFGTFSSAKEENNTAENNPINDTCEPMDVDETIPDHLLIDHSQKIENKSMQSPQKSKRKSSIESHNKSILSSFGVSSDQKNISSSEANISKQNTSTQSSKESKRKSSLSQSLNESENQNKSTLVLSHLKDVSESEPNRTSKSPQQLNDKRLSNSSTVLNVTQENILTNKNLSLCYSTSTPLQQKGSRGINVNTSNIKSPGESKLLVSKSKDSDSDSDSSESIKNKGNTSKLINQKSDSSESSDDEKQEKSNLMDDEAEDAGDDYESGDSQDEEEREEALANEIRERGETLTSDEEFSNDSDYEKDSFIVSSAEEDNELLEGTEDDLSMSDNELNMSKKSKQKYNERKLKEQKNASREMFESRHQINNSKSEKRKKRMQLKSSSESESDNEVKKPTKAKNRHILDSSADVTTNSQVNTSNKRKSKSLNSSESEYEVSKPIKTKNKQRLDSGDMNISKEDNTKMSRRSKTPSQSICNESIVDTNEKEMSINIDQVANECDPLSQSIKKEPKTPLKENMSLAFIDAQDNTNVSINEGGKLDPLGSPAADDDENDDSSMSSDNERIVQDYDLILQDLNKVSKNKIKSVDTSLNFEKKTKKKEKNPIVDQLNLTQVKGKKSKNKLEVTKSEKRTETEVLQADHDESSTSSESALMNLLFSEESNHCDDANTKNANESTSNYISLKSTTIQENNESNKTPKDKNNKNRTLSEASFTKELDADVSMNKSSSKTPKSDKKKTPKKNSESQISDINSEDGSLKFFIDTEGSGAQNISIEKKSLNRSKTSISEKDNDSDSEAPVEVSFKKDKNLSNSKIDILEGSLNLSSSITSSSKKKKKQNMDCTILDTDVTSESAKKKNKKLSISFNESITTAEKDSTESTKTLNENLPGSEKKKRNNSNTRDEIDAGELSINKSILKTPSSDKKKKKSIDGIPSDETNVTVLDTSLKTSSGKKKQKRISENSQNEIEITPLLATPRSAKKTQKSETGNDSGPEGDINKLSKAQKRKRKISSFISEEEQKDPIEKETLNNLNKQKKIKLTPQNMTEQTGEGSQEITESLKGNKNKKRKEREDDNIEMATQLLKENCLKKVSRLPTSILEQLDEKPRQEEPKRKKSKLISTTNFIVEDTKVRKNKPSMYLEESIYLHEDEKELKKQKAKSIKPKVLPFVPTASTSISGYTTNFKVNVIPKDTKFVAQSNNITNFKSEYLYGKKIKRNGTYEMYKRSRNVKLSKF